MPISWTDPIRGQNSWDVPLNAVLDTFGTAINSYAAQFGNFNVKDYGAVGNGSTNDTAAIQSAWTALTSAGGGVLFFPSGTYLTTGLVFRTGSNFTIHGARGATIWLAPSTASAPFQGTANIITIADCSDFTVEGLVLDGRRDTTAPLAILAANAAAAQPSVQIGHGLGVNYCVGQRLNLLGGLTANSGAEIDQANLGLIVASVTPGGGAANDTITFTTNLANSFTFAAASTVSDPYGPYAAGGAYITPWQTGETTTVAGRVLSEEDQQNGLHLINCTRFEVARNTIRNVWESPIRAGTHLLNGTSQTDGVSYGTFTDNVLYHGYDQGIGLWASHDCTVVGNVISSAGWAGICLTMGYDCTVTGNVCSDNVQRIPGDHADGHGIAVEGGYRNTITGNMCRNNFGPGVRLTALGTIPYGSPAQVATTVGAGSNATVLPQGTVTVGSTVGFATSGTFTVLSSAGPQMVAYTGTTGTTFTGCTGGVGTLLTGQRLTQYPLFVANSGTAIPPGTTSVITSDGTKFQVGGHYSFVDNAKTERFTVTAITTNTITLADPTTFRHSDKTQIGQAVAEDNVISGNTISTCGDAGIRLDAAVRTSIFGNVIDRAGLCGVDGTIWAAGGLVAPFGTVVFGNTITAPGSAGSGAYYQAIAFQQTSDLIVSGNRCGGAPGTTGYFYALGINSCSDSLISNNTVSDAYAVGIRIDTLTDWPCKRVAVIGNVVRGVYGEGIILFGGDSLVVQGNVIENCAANNGPAGYGGALNVRGVKNSQIVGNMVVNNGHGGIGLDTATLNGTNVTSSANVISGNISRDDGLNYDPFNGAATQQGNGISELSGGQGPNTYINNQVSGCITNWNISSTGNTLRGNQNYNPVGKFTGQPAVPASTVAYTNILNADATVHVTGGTVTVIAVGGQATGLTSGSFRVPAGQTITLTYSVAPTWVWFGD